MNESHTLRQVQVIIIQCSLSSFLLIFWFRIGVYRWMSKHRNGNKYTNWCISCQSSTRTGKTANKKTIQVSVSLCVCVVCARPMNFQNQKSCFWTMNDTIVLAVSGYISVHQSNRELTGGGNTRVPHAEFYCASLPCRNSYVIEWLKAYTPFSVSFDITIPLRTSQFTCSEFVQVFHIFVVC